jgi:ribose transport system permease protein
MTASKTSIELTPGSAGALTRGGALDAIARWWARLGPVAVLVALVIYFSLATHAFLTVGNLQSLAWNAAVLLLVALSGTLVILLGSIDLSVGSIVTLVGMSLAHFSGDMTWWLLVLLCLGVGCAAGLLNGLIYVYGRVPSFLVTLGTLYLFPGFAQQVFGAIPISLNSSTLVNIVTGQPLGIPVPAIIAVVVWLIVCAVGYYTVFGRDVYAIGGNETVARLNGINVTRTKIICFALGGVFCALAAILLSVQVLSSTGDMGSGLLLPSIAAVVIGGTTLSGGNGGPARTILGVILLEVLVDGMNVMSVSPYAQQIVEGLTVILAVLVSVKHGRRAQNLVVK